MTVIPPRYEARQHAHRDGTRGAELFGVYDTFAQDWAYRADKIARFEGLDRDTAAAQASALNRIYESTL